MATEIKLPKLGEDIYSGLVAKILVSAGDSVTEDQPVIELETEKATVEVPSSIAGTVKEVRVKEGETIKVGQVILTVEEAAAGDADKAKSEPESKRKENEQEAKSKEPGQAAKAKEAPEKIERKEATAPKEAVQPTPVKNAPALRKEPAIQEKRAEREELEEDQREEQNVATKEEQAQQAPQQSTDLVPAASSVRRMARELGIDISEVTGSGAGGRISEEDVRNYARSIILNVTKPQMPLTVTPLPDFTQWGEVERKAMTSVRRKTAAHMREAWLSIPHVTQFDQADITELEEMRRQFGERVEAAGGKLTVTAIALKVVAAALKVFPQFNASLDVEQEEIIYKKYYDIGVAVDTDRGLLVPVIRAVDKKNLLDLSVELTQIAEKTRQKKITLEEMQGGTFTITNLGGIGGSAFTPIVNSPEVAILGLARANRQPAFLNGHFEPRLMLPLGLSYDHRLIDGADAARFLRWVAQALQQPFLLTLEG